MNKINPIYILGFFVLVALIMIVQTVSMQNKIVETAQQVALLEQTGKEIGSLKKHWKNSKESTRKIDALLSQNDFKNKVLKQEKKANVYKIVLQELDASLLDRFLGKILNEYVILKKISIDRVEEDKISVNMEIEL